MKLSEIIEKNKPKPIISTQEVKDIEWEELNKEQPIDRIQVLEDKIKILETKIEELEENTYVEIQ